MSKVIITGIYKITCKKTKKIYKRCYNFKKVERI